MKKNGKMSQKTETSRDKQQPTGRTELMRLKLSKTRTEPALSGTRPAPPRPRPRPRPRPVPAPAPAPPPVPGPAAGLASKARGLHRVAERRAAAPRAIPKDTREPANPLGARARPAASRRPQGCVPRQASPSAAPALPLRRAPASARVPGGSWVLRNFLGASGAFCPREGTGSCMVSGEGRAQRDPEAGRSLELSVPFPWGWGGGWRAD